VVLFVVPLVVLFVEFVLLPPVVLLAVEFVVVEFFPDVELDVLLDVLFDVEFADLVPIVNNRYLGNFKDTICGVSCVGSEQ
jgi:hypothetical protein